MLILDLLCLELKVLFDALTLDMHITIWCFQPEGGLRMGVANLCITNPARLFIYNILNAIMGVCLARL